ncbi:hypothetical protein TRICHSKD4_4670 [Roseibium sp. TrichSKD4]|nr:hypothetical protein TRICHSKD4_4670 [Roseibium sp. TrichSKD4]
MICRLESAISTQRGVARLAHAVMAKVTTIRKFIGSDAGNGTRTPS